MSIDNLTNHEIEGPRQLETVNWKVDPDEGPMAAIQNNLELFQTAMAHSSPDGATHGIYPVEGTRYSAIVVPDAKPLAFQPTPEAGLNFQTIALVIAPEIVITPNGDQEHALVLGLAQPAKQGTVMRAFKYGDTDEYFHKTVTTNPELLAQARAEQGAAMFFDDDKGSMYQGVLKADMHRRQATQQRSLAYETIDPSKLADNGRIELILGNIRLNVVGIINNLLIINTSSAFDVFAPEK